MCIGAIFFIFGLFFLSSQKLSLNNVPILLFPLVGVLMIIIPALMLYAENSDILDAKVKKRRKNKDICSSMGV